MQEGIVSFENDKQGVNVNKHQPYILIIRKKCLLFKAFKK